MYEHALTRPLWAGMVLREVVLNVIGRSVALTRAGGWLPGGSLLRKIIALRRDSFALKAHVDSLAP